MKRKCERRRINTCPKIVFRSPMKTIWKSWKPSTTIQMSLKARQSSLQALSTMTPVMPIANFLFRFGIIHCIADSGVYGLLTKGNNRQYENNTWITAKGKLVNHYHKELKQNLPTLEIDSFTKVDKPEKSLCVSSVLKKAN